ncbi:tRNA nucleotidyltransferase, partial [Ornithobacterium rhinotracheale]
LDESVLQIISEVSHHLQQESYVIGVFVRDFLLKRTNKKDIDIVTEGSGIALAKQVAEQLPKKHKFSVFKRFGTAMFHYHGTVYEFLGARKES